MQVTPRTYAKKNTRTKALALAKKQKNFNVCRYPSADGEGSQYQSKVTNFKNK